MNATLTPVGSMAAGPDWFAIQTRYRYEKKVAEQLGGKGVEVFLPLRRESHSWSDRRKLVTIPLFPGYAFVRSTASADLRLQVLRTAGFMGFVSVRGAATSVPQKQIEDLRVLLNEEVPFSLYPFVDAGQRVRIRGGCLHGLEGILLTHDKDKLVISIVSIRRSLAIQLQGYELELV
ncbi:MAG: UpxY family transcription antiterminator [Acidobacteriia bacterium]|nr:UpxY family transcription antiterminator [Terriglobia bacterium]